MQPLREGIGTRIAAYRRRRGLSQNTLAGLIGRSESWLSQVERGVRTPDRLSVLIDLADVLHVDVADLVGRPWQLQPNGGPLIDGLDQLRYALSTYHELLNEKPHSQTDLPHLEAAINAAHRRYQAAEYQPVIGQLPALLHEAARMGSPGHYVHAYVLTAKLATKLGADDMAWIAADRAVTSAVATGDTAAQGLAAYQLVCALLSTEQRAQAEHIADTMAARLDGATSLAVRSARGSLLLIGAVIAARTGDRTRAWQRLRTAEQLAASLPDGANVAYTAFCRENVGIHRISVAVELGTATEAIEEAKRLDLGNLPEGLRSRRSQVHIDLAWAEAHRRRDNASIDHLLSAVTITPDALKFNARARTLTRELIIRGRADDSRLDRLASHAAVLAS